MPEPFDSCHDILIAGGGPVGCALALALRDSGFSVLLATGAPSSHHSVPGAATRSALDESASRDLSQVDTHSRADPAELARVARPIALSQASHAFLRTLGALTEAPVGAIGGPSAGDSVPIRTPGTPIHTIHVSQQGAFGRTVMSAAEHGLEALGYVFDSEALKSEINRSVPRNGTTGRVVDWHEHAEGVLVRTTTLELGPSAADARPVQQHLARLLVLADGGPLAEQAAGQRVHDYGQSAVLGTVRASVPHRNRAWERFTPRGPLALLPLADRYAFVWALPTALANERMHDNDDRFLDALQQAFGERAGRFSAPGPRSCAPLALKRLRRLESGPVIAIGNAAQELHPVAGQGLNLGLRDVMALAAMLDDDPQALATREQASAFARRFGRARWSDRASTITLTDLFVRAFSNDRPLLAAARGLALGALDVFPPARAFLARRMMLGARALP